MKCLPCYKLYEMTFFIKYGVFKDDGNYHPKIVYFFSQLMTFDQKMNLFSI